MPLPVDGDFYPAFLEASLFERLVIMNLDSELASLRGRRLEISRMDQSTAVMSQLLQDFADELTHARIGVRWIRHLVPDAIDRRKRIAVARQNGALVLAIAISENDCTSFEQTLGTV